MNRLARAGMDMAELDTLASQDSPVHRLHPLCKLAVTVLYIAAVVSCDKYDITRVLVFVLYPALMFQFADVPLGACFYKLRVVLPLVCAVGIVNPFLDRAPLLYLGSLAVSGGVISMLTLMLKGVLALTASFLLISTTGIDRLCAALRLLRLPPLFVSLMLLTYRYVGVLMRELEIMTDAYSLRAPGRKGIHFPAWGSFLGQLLLRSADRASELYASMQLRGFSGEFVYAELERCSTASVVWLVGCSGAIVALRIFNLAELIGKAVAL